jgi:class 3 adenylate cyclase
MARVAGRSGHPVRMRIGMATGPLLAGVIGTSKLTYDVWGPTVNLAARLESHGSPGEIHVCTATMRRLNGTYDCETLEEAEFKGLGRVARFRLIGPAAQREARRSAHLPAETGS